MIVPQKQVTKAALDTLKAIESMQDTQRTSDAV
jgi:hypothetical protein